MKSNEEFIAGIYKKAEAMRQEDTLSQKGQEIRNQKNLMHHKLQVLLPLAACLCIIAGTALFHGSFSPLTTGEGAAGQSGSKMPSAAKDNEIFPAITGSEAFPAVQSEISPSSASSEASPAVGNTAFSAASDSEDSSLRIRSTDCKETLSGTVKACEASQENTVLLLECASEDGSVILSVVLACDIQPVPGDEIILIADAVENCYYLTDADAYYVKDGDEQYRNAQGNLY